ncbi:dTDP-4-dehydrorhamnose reductase [Mycobacterium sp. PS03-16]|uniref:dTDP-4-dehydrorhamnose reductase n=1 Tax=Mycobacterium sp. PS03-16 TaxID=2559611 RepID=UPI001073DC20|nr:dTDP-4-dehydrorhamnose reductase [Mycobacterium sp. PS03-16]TFV58661.1 dTDP-4-dehydrorhamnose reductase [Mycobacterium sp. PS03-16]
MPQRLVITGAGGMVGRILAGQARQQGRDVLALTSSECDITDPGAVAHAVAADDVVVNCAAYTDVDAAESDPQRAHAVNADGPGVLAQACARAGAGLIHLSTDYVFGGDFGGAPPRPYDVDDPTGPLSVYGHSKLAGERAVLVAKPDAYVVRTAWVYEGAAGTDFVAVMRRRAAGTDELEVVADQIGSPTSAADLAGALLQIADGGVRGPLLHAANGGQASRYDQACAVFEALGADPARVRPVTSDRFPRPARRPAFSALAGAGSAARGLTPLRGWREALESALRAAS